jgi:hypothetical protein
MLLRGWAAELKGPLTFHREYDLTSSRQCTNQQSRMVHCVMIMTEVNNYSVGQQAVRMSDQTSIHI